MFTNFKDRLYAFTIHLFLSALLIAILLAAVMFSWFPNQLIYAGGITGLKIIISVDLILGPLLTFLVFNKAKKSLKFDLGFIAVLQLSCMAAGVWLMHKERPLAQVVADDGIHIISQSDFDFFDVTLPKHEGGIRPEFIFMDLPEDWSQLPALKAATELVEEKPFTFRQDLYVNINNVTEADFAKRIAKIQSNLSIQSSLTRDIEHNCEWIPVISHHNSGEACVTFEKGIVLLSDKKI